MKKFLYALLAVAATLSFASCNEDFTEENGSDPTVDTGTLTFTLKNSGPETRSETGMPTTTKGVTIPLGDPVDGYNLYLEETITELGDVYAPETKGTPVYTENFSKMFGGKFYGIAYSATGTTLSSTPVFPDGAFQDNGAGLWIRPITPDPFESYDELQMFFRAPQTVTGMGEPQYSLASNGRAITTFTYTVPLNAADQQEILITGRSVTKAEAKEPIPILFHHALTGVKFATAYDNTGSAKTYITKVEIPTGLYRSATIRITASWENGVWVDDPDTHSSESTEVYNVSNGQQLKNNEVFTLDLTESDIVDFETGGQFANKGKYPDSFAAGGNTNNLNDSDASKTFWLIPQRMNNNVVMDVTFHVVSGGKDSGPITRRINLGQLLTNSIYWRAGQIRTFTLKPELLDVDIHD